MFSVCLSRLFLGGLKVGFGQQSTILERLQNDGALDDFKNLSRRDIDWNSGRPALGSEIDTDNETELDCSKIEPHPIRKRR
jgi:hypothetical protein